jgi:diguanylate cyclase (GGDEF)-like protein/PAS domain S-box-containing protein
METLELLKTERIDLQSVLDHVHDGVYVVDANRRILHWNKSAEKITGFTAQDVMGRSCADNFLTHIDAAGHCVCKTTCPLAHTLKDGVRRDAVLFLHHKEGYRLPVQMSVHPLRDAAGNIVAAVETFRECSDVIALRSAIEQLKGWGCVDVESGLLSRRVLEHRLSERQQEMQRFGWPFSLALVEIDFMEELRQRFGEADCRLIVRMVGQSVQNALRSLDTVARWDQKTFCCIIANTTAAELVSIAERIRMTVESAYRQMDDRELHATVSVGAAAAWPADTTESLLRKAERCVYTSRTEGRNRVTLFDLPTDEPAE